MGWHFLNPVIHGFDPTKPHILVYERRGGSRTLGALEWVFPSTPTPRRCPAPPTVLRCRLPPHRRTFVFAPAQDQCPRRSPQTGAAFNFWHPDLVTLHLWLWYPNPDGLYSGTNPLVQPFNRG